jgi:hypothetical protein
MHFYKTIQTYLQRWIVIVYTLYKSNNALKHGRHSEEEGDVQSMRVLSRPLIYLNRLFYTKYLLNRNKNYMNGISRLYTTIQMVKKMRNKNIT